MPGPLASSWLQTMNASSTEFQDWPWKTGRTSQCPETYAGLRDQESDTLQASPVQPFQRLDIYSAPPGYSANRGTLSATIPAASPKPSTFHQALRAPQLQ